MVSGQIIGNRHEDAWGSETPTPANDTSSGIYCTGCSYITIVGNTFDRNHNAQSFFNNADKISVVGNLISSAGWTEAGQAFWFTGNNTEMSFAGNTITTFNSPVQVAYRVDSGASVQGIIADKVAGFPAGSNIYYDTTTRSAVAPLLVATNTTVPQATGNVVSANSLGAWTTNFATLTSATSTPWGTASSLVEDATFNVHRLDQAATTYSAINYTYSVMFRSRGPSARGLKLASSNAAFTSDVSVYFDPSNCTVAFPAAVTGTFTLPGAAQTVNMGGGWCLGYVTFNPGASYSGAHNFVEMTSGGGTSYTGDGSSGVDFYPVAVAQLKAGNAP